MNSAILSICFIFTLAVTVTTKVEGRGDHRPCTTDFRPVCAVYRKTYSNECTMNAEGSTLASNNFILQRHSDGRCQCDMACTKELNRVCGSDGTVYPNECMMRKKACETNTWIEARPMSAC